MTDTPLIPLAILTGFLGSGKTTLLNRLLKDPDMAETAVLINELGEIGIDHLIVDAVDDDIVLLESGCVCCSVRDDFTAALLSLHHKRSEGLIPAFDLVVLETTGVADPAAILQTMMEDPLICERYCHGPVITVIDACYAGENLAAQPEARSQLMLADRLVLAKADLVEAGQRDELAGRLRASNHLAPLLDAATVAPRTLFAPLTPRDMLARLDQARSAAGTPAVQAVQAGFGGHTSQYSTFHIGWETPVPRSALETWLEGLLFARGDDILRIKGVVNLAGEARPVLLQSVRQSLYQPAFLSRWPAGRPRTDLVMIARHFTKTAALNS
ncbi:MAG: GTP-binding protein, partial [Gammaproteobacteria bacterium]|nr:GTP-binding protein [Gammaproteobacteria bacterium]